MQEHMHIPSSTGFDSISSNMMLYVHSPPRLCLPTSVQHQLSPHSYISISLFKATEPSVYT
jgi:hypothetical protein